MLRTKTLGVVIFFMLVFTQLSFAESHSVGVRGGLKTPHGRYVAAGVRVTPRGRAVFVAGYSPTLAYWTSFPRAAYYAYPGYSFGYWGSSYGAYGSYYTQPGMFSSYHYGPFSTGASYLTPTYGYHNGALSNFSYARTPGQGFSLTGSFMGNSVSLYGGHI